MAGGDFVQMGYSILIAIAVAIAAIILYVKVFGKKMRLFNKMILRDSTSTESGYVSNANRLELIGREGITKTPTPTIWHHLIDDERIDAVTEGASSKQMKKSRL